MYVLHQIDAYNHTCDKSTLLQTRGGIFVSKIAAIVDLITRKLLWTHSAAAENNIDIPSRPAMSVMNNC